MKTDGIFNATIKELKIKHNELYSKDGHLTSLGICILTASMIGSGELKEKELSGVKK